MNNDVYQNYLTELYDETDLEIMRNTDDSTTPGQNRLDEIIAFAKKSGIKKIGIAHCISMTKEAGKLMEYLSKEFDVYSVGCKTGGILNKDILGESYKGVSCNPAEQALYLAENETGLNIVMGLCVGHEILFNKKSKALTTTFIVKDRKFKNNPFCIFQENNIQ